MIEFALALGLLLTPETASPTFSEAEVSAIEACVDGAGATTGCPGLEAEARVATDCMRDPANAEKQALKLCIGGAVVRCLEAAAPTSEEMIQRVGRSCSARARGGVRVVIIAELAAMRRRLSPEAYERLERARGTVAGQASEQADRMRAEGKSDIMVSGIKTGVWISFLHYVLAADPARAA